jgi:hypothetical protein
MLSAIEISYAKYLAITFTVTDTARFFYHSAIMELFIHQNYSKAYKMRGLRRKKSIFTLIPGRNYVP